MGKTAKYKNHKTQTSDGIWHASELEAARWCELIMLQKYGAIKDLKRQVEYELIPTQYETYERWGKNGKRLKPGINVLERRLCYVADFVYTNDETGEVVVEDTKGCKTREYVIKRKLMLYIHKIRVKEIT